MTEKYVLGEAVRYVISDTMYRRQKHTFLNPPAVLNPDERFSNYVHDTLRGDGLASIPFFDQKKVIGLLDSLPAMETSSHVAYDQILMRRLSMCVLPESFGLAV